MWSGLSLRSLGHLSAEIRSAHPEAAMYDREKCGGCHNCKVVDAGRLRGRIEFRKAFSDV